MYKKLSIMVEEFNLNTLFDVDMRKRVNLRHPQNCRHYYLQYKVNMRDRTSYRN